MSRKREKKGSLVKQVIDNLNSKFYPGRSKRADKITYTYEDGVKKILNEDNTKDKIYSYNTFNVYKKQSIYFVNYCKENFSCRDLDECFSHVNDYIQKLIDEKKSASSIKTAKSALQKLYSDREINFIDTPDRRRKDIKRSRNTVKTDSRFNEERNKDLVSFCRSTGLRRRELECLRGSDLVKDEETGKYFIHVQRGAKGGRERYAEIVGNENEIKNVVDRMKKVKDNKVFSHVNTMADIHSYRSDYAMRVYKKYARDVKTLSHDDLYYCRSDLKGVVYDKNAMLITSQNLGHNRINVIASNYLRADKLKTF